MKSLTAEQSSGAQRNSGACKITHPFSKPLLLKNVHDGTETNIVNYVNWMEYRHMVLSLQFRIPVTSGSLRWGVAVVIDRIEKTSNGSILWVFEVIKCGVERKSSAHPQEHTGSQTISRCPEVIFAVAYNMDKFVRQNWNSFSFEFVKKNYRHFVGIDSSIQPFPWFRTKPVADQASDNIGKQGNSLVPVSRDSCDWQSIERHPIELWWFVDLYKENR